MMNDRNKWLIYWQSVKELCLDELSDLECDMFEGFDVDKEYYPKTFEEIERHKELTSYIEYCDKQIEKHRE